MLALPLQERNACSILEQRTYQPTYFCSSYEEGNGNKYNETLSETHFVVVYKIRLKHCCFLGNPSSPRPGKEQKKMDIKAHPLITLLSVQEENLEKPPKGSTFEM